MNKRDAKNEGLNNGYSIADSNISDLNIESATIQDDLEKFISDCSEAESDSFRQYSPFEFFAHDMNMSKYPDELWSVYDESVYKGILKRVKEFKKENKIK